ATPQVTFRRSPMAGLKSLWIPKETCLARCLGTRWRMLWPSAESNGRPGSLEALPMGVPVTSAPPPLREVLTDAIRYWEPRRIGYNVFLAAIVLGWVIFTWPH